VKSLRTLGANAVEDVAHIRLAFEDCNYVGHAFHRRSKLQTLNVIDTAVRSGVFQTFTRLLEGSPLEKRLRSQESFTLFAPVDISFAYLPSETFDGLLRAESEGALMDVLGFHVAPGKIMFRELCTLCKTPTVCGVELTLDNTTDVRVEGAKLLHADIIACNGVIHAIDRLLIPTKSAAAVWH
jgi:uncharacterized surface protein with fasciclin (FAS1) repeats